MVCNYATRYPEAMGLQKVDVGSVAEQLIMLFQEQGALSRGKVYVTHAVVQRGLQLTTHSSNPKLSKLSTKQID